MKTAHLSLIILVIGFSNFTFGQTAPIITEESTLALVDSVFPQGTLIGTINTEKSGKQITKKQQISNKAFSNSTIKKLQMCDEKGVMMILTALDQTMKGENNSKKIETDRYTLQVRKQNGDTITELSIK